MIKFTMFILNDNFKITRKSIILNTKIKTIVFYIIMYYFIIYIY